MNKLKYLHFNQSEACMEKHELTKPSFIFYAVAAIIFVFAIKLTFCNIGWGLPDIRSSAKDNLILDGSWAHQGRNLCQANIDLYPPVCYLQMELGFKFLRAYLRSYGKNFEKPIIASCYIIVARCISALLTLLTASLIFEIGRQLFNIKSGLFASCLYLFNPITNYYASTTNAEASYIFYSTLAYFFAIKAINTPRSSQNIIAFFIASAVAIATKDQAGFLLFGIAIWLLFREPKRSIMGFFIAAIIFLAIYSYSGGIELLPRHLASMRANSKLFEVYTMQPNDLLKLSKDFIVDFLLIAGPGVLFALSVFFLKRNHFRVRLIWKLLFYSLIPYYLAILFLSHRSYPRYLFPYLPLIAVIAGYGMFLMSKLRFGKFLNGIVLTSIIIWTALFTVHLRENPRDRSKADIRKAIELNKLPLDVTMCLFTVRSTTRYSLEPDGSYKPQQSRRDWIYEKYGWVTSFARMVTLAPEDQEKIQIIQPQLLGIFDSDGIKTPIPNYKKIKTYTDKYPALFRHIYKNEEFHLYQRNREGKNE